MRPALALGVLVALVGCSSVDQNADAATVGDTAVTIEEFESLLDEFAARPEITGVEEDPATGSVPADGAREWLTVMVQNAAITVFLAANDEAVTDEDREAVSDALPADADLLQFSDEVVAMFVDLQAATTAAERIPAPDADELERRYLSSPAELGVMCVRHVVVATEAEANDVVEEIRNGADIEALATERSIDPTATENGGAIESGGGGCVPNQEAVAGTDPAFVAAAVTSTPGVPVGPVQTPFGWHVIEARPYEEIADSLAALYADGAGQLLFGGFMATADIQVDPRYGRWDGLSAAVIAL